MERKFIIVTKNNGVNTKVPTLTYSRRKINIKPELSLSEKEYKKVTQQIKKFKKYLRIL